MNLILSPSEIENLYRGFLKGIVSLNDINESHQTQLLDYAERINYRATRFCWDLVAANPHLPHQDFEFYSSSHNHYKESKQVVDFINNWFENQKVNKLKSSPNKKRNDNPISLKWDIDESNLIKGYEYLRANDCIDDKTTLEQFKAIFTGQSINNIKPIKWIEDTKLLAYFLDNIITDPKWQSIAGKAMLFNSKYNTPITASNLSKSKKDYKDYGRPKGYEKIDKLLNDIQKH
jgi:hypothetical protein